VKIGKAKLIGTDLDLRPKYEIVDSLKYDVILCPHCGYAAMARFFQYITGPQAKLVRVNISQAFKNVEPKGDIYTYEEAIERYKLALANATPAGVFSGNPLSGEVKDDDTFDEVCQKLYTADINAMTQTLDLIRQEDYTAAADLLEKAGKVLCMGQGGSHLLAREAAHLFSTTSGKYFAIEDGHLQAIAAATADPEDVIFFFSYSGATRDMMETFRIAKKRGVKLVLVTRYPKAPGAALADVVLQCGANESPLQLGSVGARNAQLFLLDVLFSELCRRNLDACRESRSRIADALSDKHL